MNIFLASKSPRRAQLLSQIGVEYEILDVSVSEEYEEGLSACEIVAQLSYKKAIAALNIVRGSAGVIIAADTLVVKDGMVFGKPSDEHEACKMLQAFSGKAHEVYTGVTLSNIEDGKVKSFIEKTNVYFKELTAEDIKWYIHTNEPMDKSGAYGIQGYGAKFVRKIEGDFFNVVGLPLCKLCSELDVFIQGTTSF